jgi:outer membrane receptor protein involved in Fe transport
MAPSARVGASPAQLLRRLLLLHAFPSLLLAQPTVPSTSAATAVREEVVVTAERSPEPRESVPAAISVLTRDEIERLPADDLGELLRYLPGFHVYFGLPFGGAPMVSARGFFGGGEAEYVQLLVDGVPVADVESGLADWRRIRAADVERIEALRGPASSLYGDTALGGLIQVFTRRSPTGSPGGRFSVSAGSFGTAGADLTARFAGAAATIGAATVASRTDGFREHAKREEAGADASVELPAGPGSFTLALSASNRDREEPGPRTREELSTDRFGSDPLFRFDLDETRRGRASMAYRSSGKSLPFRALLYGSLRDTDITRTVLIIPSEGDRIFRSIESKAIGGSLEGEKTFAAGKREVRALAGMDFARESISSTYHSVRDIGRRGPEVAHDSGRRERFALFFSGAWEPLPQLRVTAGTRWDSIGDDFASARDTSRRAWSPRAGVSLRLGRPKAPPVSVFFQASRAFKAPTLDQLFDPRPFPDFSGGTFQISNPRLLPQRAKTIEAGVSRRDETSSFELVVYRTEVEDEIDFDTTTFRYANIGRTLHRGVEASAALFKRSTASPFFSYSWTRTQSAQGENRGRQLKNIPEHLLRPGVTLALPAGVHVEAIASILAGRFIDDENHVSLGDVEVLDVRIKKVVHGVQVRLDLLNVTNREWEEIGFVLPDFRGNSVPYYFPGPGFAARLALDWSLF